MPLPVSMRMLALFIVGPRAWLGRRWGAVGRLRGRLEPKSGLQPQMGASIARARSTLSPI